jgi:hypothetical protein
MNETVELLEGSNDEKCKIEIKYGNYFKPNENRWIMAVGIDNLHDDLIPRLIESV